MVQLLTKECGGVLDRRKIITTAIAIGIFGGLVGGPILSLADYYAPPERRFWTFIIPEFIGFGCLILMIVWEKSRKGRKTKKIINQRGMEILEFQRANYMRTSFFSYRADYCYTFAHLRSICQRELHMIRFTLYRIQKAIKAVQSISNA